MDSPCPPIPDAAMPVVEVLRREVPRPAELPIADEDGALRWSGRSCCPMGLAPLARERAPCFAEDFGYDVPEEAVDAFANWWDSIETRHAAAAVDLIWPPPVGGQKAKGEL